MEITPKKIDNANGVVEAIISADDIKRAEEKIARDIAKQAKIDGFRKGKVPTALIKQRYGQQLQQDSRNELIAKVYQDAIKELSVTDVLGEPTVSKFEEKDGKIETEIKFSFRPSFDLGDYKSIIPEFGEIEIDNAELDKRVQESANATVEPTSITKKRKLKEQDVAVFDFEGKVDGERFENACAKDYSLVIGSKRFIDGFEDGMLGMKPEEVRVLNLKFPDDYHGKELAGKEVEFTVTLNDIKETKDAELNDDVAKKILPNVENATMESVRENVKTSLLNEAKGKKYGEELKPQIIDELDKLYNFDLPLNIVEQEIDYLAQQEASKLSEDEIKEFSNNPEKIKELRESVRGEAQKRVKTTLVIDALATKESVVVTDQEVTQVVYYEGFRMGMDPKQILEYYQKNNLLPVIKMSMIEDRVLTKLLDEKNDKKD